MKHARVAGQGKSFPLIEICGVPGVSVGGYRARKRGGAPDCQRLADSRMPALIRAIHAGPKGAYGSPRTVREPRARGFPASEGRAGRPVRDNGIRARHKRRHKVAAGSEHGPPVAENLLAGNFTPTAPNQVRTPGTTCLRADEGRLYQPIVPDLFDREAAGRPPKPRMTADIVADAPAMARFRKKPAPGLPRRPGRGGRYASHAFRGKLEACGMT